MKQQTETTDFNSLEFTPHPLEKSKAERALKMFDNGYGLSVVRGAFTMGGPKGLYQAAVVKKTRGERYKLDRKTGILPGPKGFLTPEDVSELLRQVESL